MGRCPRQDERRRTLSLLTMDESDSVRKKKCYYYYNMCVHKCEMQIWQKKREMW